MECGDKFVFCAPQLVFGYLASFESMKDTGELCDVILKVGDSSISAHRVILAAGIPYFKDAFTTADAGSKSLEIAMTQTDSHAVVSLVNFVYTGKIEISTENILSLFYASVFLGLRNVQEACCEFMSKRLSVENVMTVRKLAEDLGSEAIVERSDSFVAEHFREFSQTNNFLTMPFCCLKKLICSDYLAVETEEEVFEAVMKWVEYLDAERHVLLPELLLKGVRMNLLNPTYLFKIVARNERIRGSAVCRDLFNDITFFILLPGKGLLFRSLSTSPRHSCKKIYAISSSIAGCFVKFHNTKSEIWSLFATNNKSDHFLDVLLHNEKIYLFGGQVFGSFHLKTHQWSRLELLHEQARGAGVVLHSDRIYICGSSWQHLSRQVCCYDIFRNTWQEEGHMIEHRTRPGVVSMGGYIYVLGGYPDGMSWNSGVHNSVERYDPQEKKSHSLPSMLFSRYWFGTCALNNRIYVCGGCDNKKDPYSSSEMFNPISNQWSLIRKMNTARYSFSLVPYNKKLHAVGGKYLNGWYTNTVEIYDPESNVWTFSAPLDVNVNCLISLRACTD